ncbi:MAG TPA: iron-sulfur cluster repair di-iron protein [Flavisolibacter sp.]|nr:iron-sulfur cluster repair di-iron protein [Flavisolibacter sp.]
MQTIDSLFVPELAPAQKHPTVLNKFDNLKVGESFLLINDHDPIPLYYEMKAEKGEIFTWKKVENGPEVWKVEITKTGGSTTGSSNLTEQKSVETPDNFVLNVTLIEPRLKHPTIFKHFDALKAGQAFQILNDHDPKPLYYQMLGERGNVFTWEYLEKGSWWRVQIRKNDGDVETLGEIATKDLRKAEIFKKYGLDFCCGGKKTVRQACADKGIDATKVEEELQNAEVAAFTRPLPYNDWSLGFLADYIVNTHHSYVTKSLPELKAYAAKVAKVHGGHHPELVPVRQLVEDIDQELTEHMVKEENILFPFIKQLEASKNNGKNLEAAGFGTVQNPINMMEHEHEAVGKNLEKIRVLTNNYSIPEDACASYKLLFKMLEEFESDLFTHIHLENNILFPKALKLEKQ